MRPFRRAAFAASFLVAAASQADGLQVDHAWTRATPPGADVAAAYLRIANPAGQPADTLLGATTEIAAKAELHTHREEKGAMRMRPLASIPIPPGQVVEARPGGLHVMLTGLARPLVAGRGFTLVLQFEHAGKIPVPVEVEPLDVDPDDARRHHHH